MVSSEMNIYFIVNNFLVILNLPEFRFSNHHQSENFINIALKSKKKERKGKSKSRIVIILNVQDKKVKKHKEKVN